MRPILAALFALHALPAMSGVREALDDVILPGFGAFAAAAETLAEAAAEDCTAANLAAPYNAAFDAWMQVGDLRIGPSENRAHAIAFWPDPRGFTPRTLQGLIAAENPVIDTAEAFSDVSVAGRGLFALEMLLLDPAFASYGTESYSCRLAQRLAADLAAEAAALDTAWAGDFADTLRTAGAPENAAYLTEGEALRALYTQVLAGLEFTADSRIARPLGSFDAPRPDRAEAWRSSRSLRNVVLEADVAVALAHALVDHDLPLTDAALADVHDAADKIEDPGFQDVADPAARFKLEVLGQKTDALTDAIEQEVGLVLGLKPGFNSQDGD